MKMQINLKQKKIENIKKNNNNILMKLNMGKLIGHCNSIAIWPYLMLISDWNDKLSNQTNLFNMQKTQ